MEDVNCIVELDCYDINEVDYDINEVEKFIKEKSHVFEEERKVRLFEKFKQARESCRKRAEERMKINGKLTFLEYEEDPSTGQRRIKPCTTATYITVKKSKDEKNKPKKTYMHLENSYMTVPKNIIKIEGEHDEVIVKLVREGRKQFPSRNGNQMVMNAIKVIYNVTEEYIREVLKDSIKNCVTKPVDVPDACSSKCYKKYKGEKCYIYELTVADETQIKLKLLSSSDYCAIAKEMSRNCNDVYSVAKSTALGSGTSVKINPKKLRLIQKTNFSQYKKVSELYEGNPGFYKPCDHQGECDESCPCFQSKNFCEIFCCCSQDCKNRFFGCVCKAKCENKACPCVAASRECLIGQCPCKPNCEENGCCNNMKIQNNQRKKINIAPSSVAGFGAFAGEDIKKGDFVVEYTGELITHEETEKRGMAYNQNKLSYIFDLTNDYAVDALYIGNESRYLNHSDNPNCVPKFMTVLGDKRIGFYADRNIKTGEEMFIDYRYNDEQKKFYFGKK